MAYTTNTTNVSANYASLHGLREHLMDWVSIVSPTDVPLTRMLEQEAVGNPYYEWQLDNIEAPSTDLVVAEGSDIDAINTVNTDNNIDSRLRAKNRSAIYSRVVDLSDRMRQINYAGVSDEFAYQLMKQSISCAKQNEYNLHWSASVSGSSAKTQGLIPWILMTADIPQSTNGGNADAVVVGVNWDTLGANYESTVLYKPVASISTQTLATPSIMTIVSGGTGDTTDHGLLTGETGYVWQGTSDAVITSVGTSQVLTASSASTFSYPPGCSAARTAGNAILGYADFTRADMNIVLSGAWNKGMNIDGCVALCGAGMKRTVSQFALVYSGSGTTQSMNLLNNRNSAAADKIITDTIDVYDSDFGKVFFNLDRYMNGGTLQTGAAASGIICYDDSLTDSVGRRTFKVHPQATLVFIEPSMLKIASIQNLAYTPLAKVGLSTKGLVSIDQGLIVKNPVCTAGIFGYRSLA